MIVYLSHKNIDKKKWDRCILESSQGFVYALSWYLDIVSPNWDALVEGDYDTVMPLTWKKKYGIKYLFPPFFTQQLGVFSKSKLEEQIVNKFIEEATNKFKFIDIKLNEQNTLSDYYGDLILNTNFLLSLNKDYSNLVSTYSKNIKRNLKKATETDFLIEKATSPKALIQIFRSSKGESISFDSEDYQNIEKIMDASIKKEEGELFYLRLENEILAGCFFIHSFNRRIFLFSGTTEKGKEQFALFCLIDNYIKENAGKQLILDFEGSNIPGLARLYAGFGSEKVTYPSLKLNNLPGIIRWLKK